MTRTSAGFLFAILVSIGGFSNRVCAQVGTALRQQKISALDGGLAGPLEPHRYFGRGLVALGDLSGDGTIELAALDAERSLWILSLGADGRVVGERRVDATGDWHNNSLARLGDLDGDGVPELAFGYFVGGRGGYEYEVEIVFLNADGSERSRHEIEASDPVFAPAITPEDGFGNALAGLGDVNGDGIPDLAIGTPGDDDGPGLDNGAVWILHLQRDGSPSFARKISELRGGGQGLLDVGYFGYGLAALGDLDGDGNEDLLVGNPGISYMNPALQTFSLEVLFLDENERVQRVSSLLQDEFATFEDASGNPLYCLFGFSVSVLGDLDRDGTIEFAVGVPSCEGGSLFVGSLRRDGTLARRIQVAEGRGGFTGDLDSSTSFGWALASLGDIDGDGASDLAVGAIGDDDGGPGTGAIWILGLDASPVRNGSGRNAVSLAESSQPSVGHIWKLSLDCSGQAPGIAMVAGYARPQAGLATPVGELLVDLTSPRLFRFDATHHGTPTSFLPEIPPDLALFGLELHVQGLCTGAPGARLSNALDVVVGK